MSYVASITVWVRVSADYDVVKRRLTKSFSEVMSIEEIMSWARSQTTSENGVMGASNVVITPDEP